MKMHTCNLFYLNNKSSDTMPHIDLVKNSFLSPQEKRPNRRVEEETRRCVVQKDLRHRQEGGVRRPH